jgi:hypothetical protein
MELEASRTESTCVIVTAHGSEQVHLAVVAGDIAPTATLCQRQVLPTSPTRHFQEAGCCDCAKASLEQGFSCAQEAAHVVVNVRRFYDRASREAEVPAQRVGEGLTTPAAPLAGS